MTRTSSRIACAVAALLAVLALGLAGCSDDGADIRDGGGDSGSSSSE